MHFRLILLGLACVSFTACVSHHDFYAPPPQRKPLDEETLNPKAPMVDMSEANADKHIVQDIPTNVQASSWRWTGKRPTVRVSLLTAANLKFHMDFALPDATFKDTGPVTLSYYVNDHLLEKLRYDSPGQKTFDREVPVAWLHAPGSNKLAVDVDKVWVSKEDGAKLGFILTRIGLLR